MDSDLEDSVTDSKSSWKLCSDAFESSRVDFSSGMRMTDGFGGWSTELDRDDFDCENEDSEQDSP